MPSKVQNMANCTWKNISPSHVSRMLSNTREFRRNIARSVAVYLSQVSTDLASPRDVPYSAKYKMRLFKYKMRLFKYKVRLFKYKMRLFKYKVRLFPLSLF
jgi:hypothetical protein